MEVFLGYIFFVVFNVFILFCLSLSMVFNGDLIFLLFSYPLLSIFQFTLVVFVLCFLLSDCFLFVSVIRWEGPDVY